MERTFRFKNDVGWAKIVTAPSGVEVIYRPYDDRLPGRRVPCADILAALQVLFGSNSPDDPLIIDFHYVNDDDETSNG